MIKNPDIDLSKFSSRLEFAMKDPVYGMSQDKLAKELNVTQQTVSNWINEKNNCKIIDEVAKSLNLEIGWLKSGSGSMRAASDLWQKKQIDFIQSITNKEDRDKYEQMVKLIFETNND